MKTINVLMSTFNGEQFIDEQVESIMCQRDVITTLLIRDDGSTDDTIVRINRLKEKYGGRISLICGENIGYRRSFLTLLGIASDTDYYAFADQDDVWKDNKCIEAVNCLSKCDGDVWLYASGLLIADENLSVISENKLSNYNNTIESYFTRGRLSGCTFLFTRELREKVKVFSDLTLDNACMPAHDFLVASVAYVFGGVFIDHRGLIIHRRHKKSVTSGGRGLVNRINTEWKLLTKRKHVNSVVAKLLIDNFEESIDTNTKGFLNAVLHYQDGLQSKIQMLVYPNFSSGNIVADILARIKILINEY